MFIYKFKELPLIFIFNEKCACTTIKNMINDIDHLYDTEKYFDVHGHQFSNMSIDELSLDNESIVLFFSRNPYSRFLSGYSKIRYKSILKLRVDSSKTQNKCNELVNNGNINVDEWATIIHKIEPKYLESHFRPQTHGLEEFLKLDRVILYDINRLSQVHNYLEKTFQISLPCEIHDSYDLKKEEPNEKTKQLVVEYYKHDFELLNYSTVFSM